MGPYPYERWARLSRVDARLSGHLARALGGLEGGLALSDARNVLGAEVTIRRLETRVGIAGAIAVALGESVGLVLALGAQRGVIALAPGIARVIADRVVGGSGRDVALGPTPLSRGEAGLVGYVVARAMARSSAPGSLLDAGNARDAIGAWGAARVVTIAVELSVGDAHGAASLVVPASAIEALPRPSPRIDPAFRVEASLVIGQARLFARDVASLALGDVVVPDTLTIDPRIADTGRARLIVGRSSRVLELELGGGAWRVVRPTSLAAPRAPSSWKQRKKEAPMSVPDTDTVQSLADVEVEVAIELARLEMPIAELAALAPGAVVTTGRLVGERVALRAGDRVIAWGELVDVEGEVGVRLTEVGPRAD